MHVLIFRISMHHIHKDRVFLDRFIRMYLQWSGDKFKFLQTIGHQCCQTLLLLFNSLTNKRSVHCKISIFRILIRINPSMEIILCPKYTQGLCLKSPNSNSDYKFRSLVLKITNCIGIRAYLISHFITILYNTLIYIYIWAA